MSTLRVRLLLPLLFFLASGCAAAKPQTVEISELKPLPRQVKTTLVINRVLENLHYRKVRLDDDFAEQILTHYLETLDPNRLFFLQSDIDRFRYRAHELDDDLRRGRVDLGFEIFRTYRERVEERVDYALRLLKKGFDFSKDETYRFDREDAPWAKDAAELDEIWRKRVKNDWLSLRLAHKTDGEIRDLLKKRYEGIARRVRQFDSDDVYQVFINAYTESLEPHTGYMSPSTSENFDISMRLSLEGIGAVLRTEGEYTVIQRTIPGGPARQSGQIHSGDRIVGVAQGADGPMEDVVGWRLQDVVDKIRGPKGSVVRLLILPKAAGSDPVTREVLLVRKEIKLEDQAAKRYVLDDLPQFPGVRIGVIEIPAFYRDFRAEALGKRDFRSTTRDVRRLIQQLKKEKIDGLLIDLRGNGGGSLAEATALTGLFIDRGPVVQVKDAFGKREIEEDPEPGVVYEGPLAVLVDRNSASASEIFAGALQDYGRALIIGEPTFGKGTVQTLLRLNRYVPGYGEDLGRMRLTMAEFFRVSGGSTQLRGVTPDILFPTALMDNEHGERSLDNPLPWSAVTPARFTPWPERYDLDWLRARSRARIAKDPGFQMLIQREQLLRELEEQTVVSLQEDRRKIEARRREKILKEARDDYLRDLGIIPVDEESEDVDEEALKKQQDAIDRIQVREAANILADALTQRRSQVRAAQP